LLYKSWGFSMIKITVRGGNTVDGGGGGYFCWRRVGWGGGTCVREGTGERGGVGGGEKVGGGWVLGERKTSGRRRGRHGDALPVESVGAGNCENAKKAGEVCQLETTPVLNPGSPREPSPFVPHPPALSLTPSTTARHFSYRKKMEPCTRKARACASHIPRKSTAGPSAA